MSMQALTGDPHLCIVGIFSAIHGITGNRVRQGSHVYPDLMGAAGFQAKLEEGQALGKPFPNPPVGHGLAAIFPNRHFFPMDGMTADGQINPAGLTGRLAMDKGEIDFFHLAPLELVGQGLVGEITFGNHHNT
jgi:hypothetical protein